MPEFERTVKVLRQFHFPPAECSPKAIAIGYFDGVHRGHQAVLEAAVKGARTCNGEAWVLTFDPHPLKLISPENAPRMLTAIDHKIRLFKQYGIDGCMVIPFTPDIQNMTADGFVRQLAENTPGICKIVVGEDWSFGKDQSGNLQLLGAMGTMLGIDVTGVKSVLLEGQPISSTRIRLAAVRGELNAVQDMLGRPFSLYGRVVEGRKMGRQLGFPTANIDPENEVHLPDGIYAARVEVLGSLHPAAAYIGKRPSFGVLPWVVEAHLLDEQADLYGEQAEIFFLEKIRDDRTFGNLEELKEQMRQDVEHVREYLAHH